MIRAIFHIEKDKCRFKKLGIQIRVELIVCSWKIRSGIGNFKVSIFFNSLTSKLKKNPNFHFIKYSIKKQITAEEISFEWSHHRISWTDSSLDSSDKKKLIMCFNPCFI